ncbi:MAG: YhcH/YjgK/YiaL family protein [Clostridia bacterium]|nr:YhcH/YjgK/YiaL family protein [Clostridia bacterium]
MLKGSLKNIEELSKYGDNFKTAVKFLQTLDFDTLLPQKYEIDGSNVYAFFCEVNLVEPTDAKLETHNNYADIQIVTCGCEGMQYAPKDTLTVNTQYNPDHDIAFYNDTENAQMLEVSAGEFALFMPQDAHKPNCFVGKGKQSKKLVVKVRI